MIASAANGFMNTSPFSCKGRPFNFQPEYTTARPQNVIPWGIGPYMINSQFEIGHFEPCSRVSGPVTSNRSDTFYTRRHGPLRGGQGQREGLRAQRRAVLPGGRYPWRHGAAQPGDGL